MKKNYYKPVMEIIPIQTGYLMDMPGSPDHGDPKLPSRREPAF